jgi:hypothetical protein
MLMRGRKFSWSSEGITDDSYEKEESPKWALFSTIDYEFRDCLLAQGKTRWTIREIVIYTKRFSHISDTGDASPLLKLSPSNK